MCKCRVSLDELNNDKGDYTRQNYNYDLGRIQNRASSIMAEKELFFDCLDEPFANNELTEHDADVMHLMYEVDHNCKLHHFPFKEYVFKAACHKLQLSFEDYKVDLMIEDCND